MKCTQEQLEAMSDFELSVALSILDIKVNQSECKSIEHDKSQNCIWVERAGFSSYPTLDINNPNDTMPLAFEADLGINKAKATANCWFASSSDNNIQCMNKNPLRALAIVWILVKQAC